MATSKIQMQDKSYTSGTDGIWTYRKYDDGTYHAWYEGAINLLAGIALGGGYYHKHGSVLTAPSFSKGITSLSGANNSATLLSYLGHSENYETYWWNASAGALTNVQVRLDMYGNW